LLQIPAKRIERFFMKEYDLDHEKTFISAFQAGEEKVFRYVFEKFYSSLCVYCLRLIREECVAADLVQEAFVKLWENRQNFSSLLTIRSYLYTIVRNSGINYLRYVKMKAEKLEERGEETETSAVELIIRQEVERQLLEMIQELTPECRRVVNLLSEGKSYKEVGELLHISANTVKNHRVRAVKILRERVQRLWGLFI
jgi:RNA polymerase sigma-70 factor